MSPEDRARQVILPPVLLALTFVTGVVDAVAYFGLGKVFTANMTGNVVFLGFAVAGAPGLSVARSLAALAAFLVGAVMGGRMAVRMGAAPVHRWTGAAFAAEAALLVVATAAAAGAGIALAIEPTRLYAVIVLTGLAMGIRTATVRKLALPDLTTTVLSLTIAGLAADSTLAEGRNPGWARRAGSVATMFAGAAAGACLLRYSIAAALALASVISGLCAVISYTKARERGLFPSR